MPKAGINPTYLQIPTALTGRVPICVQNAFIMPSYPLQHASMFAELGTDVGTHDTPWETDFCMSCWNPVGIYMKLLFVLSILP